MSFSTIKIIILTIGGFTPQSVRVNISDIPKAWEQFVKRSCILALSPGEIKDNRYYKCCDLGYYSVTLSNGTTMITDDEGANKDSGFAAVKNLVMKKGPIKKLQEPVEF